MGPAIPRHPERAIFPWQCGYYPADRKENDEVTPWIEAFLLPYGLKWTRTTDLTLIRRAL